MNWQSVFMDLHKIVMKVSMQVYGNGALTNVILNQRNDSVVYN